MRNRAINERNCHDLGHEPRRSVEALRAASERDVPASRGDFVIGTVGQDVPIELIAASGATQLRLRGNPEWGTERADGYLGQGVDRATRSILEGVLQGAFGELDAIVVSSDCDASQRLYYVLREIRRTEPLRGIPQIHLIDILHLPRESTARYNLTRMTEFAEVLREWTGAPLTGAALEDAMAVADRRRSAQRSVMRLRREEPARLSGADALAIYSAADRMEAEHYLECLRVLDARGEELPQLEGRRIFLSGSDHDRRSVYERIEGRGAVIVGEDHGWGDPLAARDIDGISRTDDGGSAGQEPVGEATAAQLDRLARRYQANGPSAQRGSILDRATATVRSVHECRAELLLSYVRLLDEAPLWDFAQQRAALGDATSGQQPIEAAVVIRQEYGQIDPEALGIAIDSPERTSVNGVAA